MIIHGVKNLDVAGRAVLPSAARKKAGLNAGDSVSILASEDGYIYLTKYVEGCIFCGNTSELMLFQGKKICSACIKEAKNHTLTFPEE